MTVRVLVTDEREGDEGEMGILKWRSSCVVPGHEASCSLWKIIAVAQERFPPTLRERQSACQVEVSIWALFVLDAQGKKVRGEDTAHRNALCFA